MSKAPSVMRNALWLVGAQVLGAPLSVLVNAVTARYLGPDDFGRLYLAMTFASFSVLFMVWGQFGTLTGKIAAQRDRAGNLLGSAMAIRAGAAVVATGVVLLICWRAGYPRPFLEVMALAMAVASLGALSAAALDAVRGFERTDFGALCYLGQQTLQAVLSVSILVLGFRLNALLSGQIVIGVIGVIFVLAMLPRFHIPRLSVSMSTVRELFRDGQIFLIFAVIVELQPLVDGVMMAHFASTQSIGWYAAARKLIGVLSFPATAVGTALYPTLVRQIATDPQGYRSTTHRALRALSMTVFPVCLGCALFPQLGVMIFSTTSYGPAEQDVRVLALWLFLVYFTITLSQCIMSSGRRGLWAGAQFMCVIVSASVDPFMISWFQAHTGNGGLGVCIASTCSEILMLVCALALVPKGLLPLSVLRLFGKPALAGALMATVGLLISPFNWPLACALSLLAYGGTLLLTGAFKLQEVRALIWRPQ